MPDFLPRRDADLMRWTLAFADTLSADPARFELSPEQVAEYVQLRQQFSDAYVTTRCGSTDSSVATTWKNQRRATLKDQTRALVRQIRPRADETLLASLGLRPRKTPTRLAPPDAAPLLRVIELRGRSATVHLFDARSPTRRGMPKHVPSGEILACVKATAEPPIAGDHWTLAHATSRARCTLELPTDPHDVDAGRRVWICARWSRGMKQMSPTSSPICLNDWHKLMRVPSPRLRLAA